MGNYQKLQLGLSVLALVCLLTGWLQIFPQVVNDFLYNKLFYIVIALTFVIQAPNLPKRGFVYPMYLAALMCIVGAFIPEDSQLGSVKTIGLFAGVIISVFNRSNQYKEQ